MFNASQNVIFLDFLENGKTPKEDVVLPAATFAEGDGTLVNNEGRAQRYFQVLDPQDAIQESWRWMGELISLRGHELSGQWHELDDVLHTLAEQEPLFAPILKIAPLENFRIVEQKIPRQPHRYSGRTAMHANVNVSEPKPPDDADAPLTFSMEGYKGHPPSSLISRYWSPGWNSVQALNKFQAEVGGPLIGGTPGQRLIEPSQESKPPYAREIPEAFVSRRDEYLALPLYHIFGSEELSRSAPAVAERMPEAYAAVHPALAKKFGAEEGQPIRIELKNESLRLPLHLNASLPENVIGLPAGFPDIPAILPAWVKLEPSTEEEGA